MTRHWHGPHLSLVADHREVQRLGSICAEAEDPPQAYLAAGLYHRPAVFNMFGAAQRYLDGPGNRRETICWEEELPR